VLTCFSKYYFGVECPGCGAQRSAVCLFRGEWLDSLALYPALIPFFIFMVVAVLSVIKSIKMSTRWVLIMAMVTFGIMIVHYIMKVSGMAPWYYEASNHFHL
jgi:ABC-type transport system involved in cytochrome c biogenesis permease component